jgi:hypothetical protein
VKYCPWRFSKLTSTRTFSMRIRVGRRSPATLRKFRRAEQVKESLGEAGELVRALREADLSSASLVLIDRLNKCLEAASSASEALPEPPDGETEDQSLDDILF